MVICLRKTSFIGHPRGKSPFIIGTRSSIGGGPLVRPTVRLWWRWLLPARFCRTRIFVTLQWSALFCDDVYKILTRATMIQKSCDILDVKNCCPQGRSIGPSNREGLSEWHMAKPHVKSRRRWYHFTFGHPLLTDLPQRSILSWRGGRCRLMGTFVSWREFLYHLLYNFIISLFPSQCLASSSCYVIISNINLRNYLVLKKFCFWKAKTTLITICTVPVIWNWTNRCILGLFLTQKFCWHELWRLCRFRICPKASLTHRLWEI